MAFTTIDDPEKYFQCKIYTGDGSTSNAQTFDGDSDMQPDVVWFKRRSGSGNHFIYDSIRGANRSLVPNDGDTEATSGEQTTYLASFDSDGFTLGDDVNNVNANTETYVAWCWKAAGSNANNSDGDISSVIRANTTSGFSIVTYTGNATSGQGVGHGLGIAPKIISIKNRDQNDNWILFTTATDNSLDYITSGWQDSNGKGDSGLDVPTTSIFDIHSDAHQNATGEKYVAYCWAEVKGFSKIGSFVGNGNANGPFVYTGFKPAFLLTKKVSEGSGEWHIYDNKREPDNVRQNVLSPNLAAADSINANCNTDLLSNGFKIRNNNDNRNDSAETHIYMAFAESPFVNSNGVPNNAE